jgi:hypothetical protein
MEDMIESSGKKRRKAMQSRLKALGMDNPVVKRAVKRNEPKDAYDDFEIVHELVSSAYAKYADGEEPLNKCLLSLADAIKKAAGKKGSKRNDDGDGSAEDDDY